MVQMSEPCVCGRCGQGIALSDRSLEEGERADQSHYSSRVTKGTLSGDPRGRRVGLPPLFLAADVVEAGVAGKGP